MVKNGYNFYKTKRMNKIMNILAPLIKSHLDQTEGFSNRWHALELGEKIVDALDEAGIWKVND